MKRLIKNYTTEIPVERTIAEIQKILSENGASAIAIEYRDGAITDIFFKVKRNGNDLPFRLPAKVEGVFQALWGSKEGWEYTRYGTGWRKQAERIAWRICKTAHSGDLERSIRSIMNTESGDHEHLLAAA